MIHLGPGDPLPYRADATVEVRVRIPNGKLVHAYVLPMGAAIDLPEEAGTVVALLREGETTHLWLDGRWVDAAPRRK